MLSRIKEYKRRLNYILHQIINLRTSKVGLLSLTPIFITNNILNYSLKINLKYFLTKNTIFP